jgi:hypothetical protein
MHKATMTTVAKSSKIKTRQKELVRHVQIHKVPWQKQSSRPLEGQALIEVPSKVCWLYFMGLV